MTDLIGHFYIPRPNRSPFYSVIRSIHLASPLLKEEARHPNSLPNSPQGTLPCLRFVKETSGSSAIVLNAMTLSF